MPLEPGGRIGGYEIVAFIDEGGMGQVYRATDTKLGGLSRSRFYLIRSQQIPNASPASSVKPKPSLR
jgi:hypothetical protein